MNARLLAFGLLIVGVIAGYIAYPFFNISGIPRIPFRLGLDLAGGSHLIYRIDTSSVANEDRDVAMESLKEAIERRVDAFGVAEPVVQLSEGSDGHRLIVELAGVFDIEEAIRIIGDTPVLEFRTESALFSDIQSGAASTAEGMDINALYDPTELTGKYLSRARVDFDPNTNRPYVSLTFNEEGARLFEKLTTDNVGRTLAIFLDGEPISTPVVQGAISGGNAQITGEFTTEEARTLVRRLNAGALPLNVELIGQQSVEAQLGKEALARTLTAGLIGIGLVMLFMIVWYRLPGFLAVLALTMYMAILLALFKLIPVTLSAAAVTGFILSVGMAVDANILIFERMKEELQKGKSTYGAVEEGFNRAWTSIWDSNISSIITSIILYWFGTSFVKGFALTLGLGVLVSMFSAIFVTKTFLRAIIGRESPMLRTLMGTGFHKTYAYRRS